MAKIWVNNPAEDTRVPFLRGILTRTLTDAGLTFEEAYALSSKIRSNFDPDSSVTTSEIREAVLEYLSEHYGDEITQAYISRDSVTYNLMVLGVDNEWSPFYRSQHRRCLESCGLDQEKATIATEAIINNLHSQEITEVTVAAIGRMTYDYLLSNFNKIVAHRYMVWIDHLHSGRPLILLIGGTTGSGKSTIATEVAHQLGIVRTQSTDMLREVMRTMIPERFLPALHVASFNAGDALPMSFNPDDDHDSQVTNGYLLQSEFLAVSCEAVIQRALHERVSLILEGVHVHPSLLDRIDTDNDAVVVMVTLAILKPRQLKARLSGRLLEAPDRKLSSHLSQIDKIWQMQSFLLSEADRMGITILSNDDKERVTNRVMQTVIDKLVDSFSATPEEVFPTNNS